MNRFRMMLAAGALSLTAAAAASAQQAPADQTPPGAPSPATGAPVQNQPGMGAQDMAPSAASAGANTSAQVVTPNDAPSSQVQALSTGDNTLVTNGPIPDTPANRAKFGGPMSMTGKHTKPAGN
jgi:hypothetical protein